jgi:hypothetical protein
MGSIEKTEAKMRRLFFQGLAGLSLLALALAAYGQNAPEQIHDPFYSQDQYQNTHSMFDKIQADLNRAATNAYPNYLGDRARFDIARTALNRLEQNWDHAQYDSRQMENTVSALRMVLNDNRLTVHDRDVLRTDISRLGDFALEYY